MDHTDLINQYNLTNFTQFDQNSKYTYHINPQSIIYRQCKRTDKINILKGRIRSYTDRSIAVYINKKMMNVHSIMGAVYLNLTRQQIINNMSVNHINHSRYSNKLNNLEIISIRDNVKHWHTNSSEQKEQIIAQQNILKNRINSLTSVEDYIRFVLNS